MRSVITCAPLLLILGLCGCEETKTRLPAPTPPFAAKNASSSASRFPAKVKGETIVAGTKQLQMNKYGNINFSANGQTIGYFIMPFAIKDKKTGKRKYLGVNLDWPKEHFAKSEHDFSGDKFRFSKTIVNEGKEATVNGVMDVTPDGNVQLSYQWTDFDSPDFQLVPYSLMFNAPSEIAKNCAFDIDGANGLVPEEGPEKLKNIHSARNCDNLALFPNKLDRSIKVSSPKNAGANVYCEKRLTSFRISPEKGAKSFKAIVDIGDGPAVSDTPRKRAGGIDFIAVEDLELPDYAASRNVVSNPSFERGMECYRHYPTYSRHVDHAKINWSLRPFTLDNSVAKFGEYSLKLHCSPNHPDFRWKGFHCRSFPVPLEKGQYCVSVYAKGEPGKKQYLSMWIPGVQWLSCGKVSLPINSSYPKPGNGGAKKVFNLTPEWKRYSFSFTLPGSMPTQVSIGSSCADGEGHAWIDGVQLETGPEPTEFQPRPVEGWLRTANPGNFLDINSPIDARMELTSSPNATGTATITVKDFFKEELFRHKAAFTCDAKGKAVLELPTDAELPQGIFVVKGEYELADGTKTYDFHRLSIMKFQDGECRLKDIFAEDYGPTYERADFLRLLRRYRKVGFGARTQIHTWEKEIWDAYREHKVTPTDAYLFSGIKNERGFAVVDLVGPTIHLRPDDPRILLRPPTFDASGQINADYLAELKTTIAKVVKEHPWITTWLGGNETLAGLPLKSYWAQGGDDAKGFENLAKFQKAIIEGVKQGNPNAKTVSDQPCNMRPDGGIKDLGNELAALNRLGGVKFDYVGCHPYRATPESPDLDADTKTYIEMLKEHGYGDTPIFWGEGMHYGPYNIPQWHIRSATWGQDTWYYGALSYDMGWTEKVSAAWRARSWLVALKYQDHVKTAMSGSGQNNFDMDLELTPFATQKMPNTLSNLLGDAYFKKDIRFAPYVRCYMFEDAEKRPVAAVWCHHPKLDAGTMDAPVASIQLDDNVDAIFDLMERERAYEPNDDGAFEFPVTSFPAFFRGEPGTLDAFIKAFDAASLISGAGIAPVALVAKPVSPTMAVVKAKNFLSKPFNGTLSLPGSESASLSVPASGVGETEIKLPSPLADNTLTPENLILNLKSDKNAFGCDVGFEGLLCAKATKDFPLNCDLTAWKDIPEVRFPNRIQRRGAGKSDKKDFDAWFKVAWSEKGLNILVKAIDDKFVHVPMDKDGNRWENDSLQIYIDTLCEARWRQTKGYDDSEYDYAVFPSPDGKSAVTYRFRQPDPQLSGLVISAPQNNALAPEIPSAFKRDANGYVYQVFIPAKYLLPIKLEKGYALGFALLVNDRDDSSPKAKRECGLSTTPRGTEPYNTPKRWQVMLLWE